MLRTPELGRHLESGSADSDGLAEHDVRAALVDLDPLWE
jgi:hypothetical protein